MNKRDLVSVDDLSPKEIFEIISMARKLKRAPLAKKRTFKDRTFALIFQKPSNRTRISFEVALVHLGGHVLYLSPNEIEMGTRETVKDVGNVVSRYVDGIVARVFSHDDIVKLARHSNVPVINGLSDLEHPCQALSDIFTVSEKRNLKRTVFSYVGDGNNVLNSLLLVCAKTGVSMRAATPDGYGPSPDILERAMQIAKENKARIELFNDPFEAVKGSHIVYTDVWVSMGQESDKEKKLKAFEGFQVNERLIRSAGEDILIMHCLPAHRGEEITDVIDGKNSIVYDQAENRMHTQKAVVLKIFGH